MADLDRLTELHDAIDFLAGRITAAIGVLPGEAAGFFFSPTPGTDPHASLQQRARFFARDLVSAAAKVEELIDKVTIQPVIYKYYLFQLPFASADEESDLKHIAQMDERFQSHAAEISALLTAAEDWRNQLRDRMRECADTLLQLDVAPVRATLATKSAEPLAPSPTMGPDSEPTSSGQVDAAPQPPSSTAAACDGSTAAAAPPPAGSDLVTPRLVGSQPSNTKPQESTAPR